MKKLIFFFLIGIILLPSCKKDKTPETRADVVFVYKTNAADAQAYKVLMEAKNKKVDMVDWTAVNSYDFSNIKLVVIGTGPGFAWADTLQPAAATLRQLNKPFLYIGDMGGKIAFYNKKIVNWMSSAFGNIEDVKALNTASAIFNTPNSIAIPASGNLTLSNPGAGAQHLVFYGSPLLPAGVTGYGQSTSSPEYYLVTMENGNSGTYGWMGNIDNLTTTGKNLLVNMSFSLGGL